MYGPMMTMGPGWRANQQGLNLSASDVRAYLEHWVAWTGNRNIKVGHIVETNPTTITADIVTVDGKSLVERFTVDRRTGMTDPSPGTHGPMMGRSSPSGQPARNLTTNDVKDYVQHWIDWTGNRHIKVGEVVEKDQRTITADIVTEDKKSLVQRLTIDRRTGMMAAGMGMYGPMTITRQGWQEKQPGLNLSASDVKTYLDHWVAWTGNRNIKAGHVIEKDERTITADIVTKDNSLVQQFTVDRRTGFYNLVQ